MRLSNSWLCCSAFWRWPWSDGSARSAPTWTALPMGLACGTQMKVKGCLRCRTPTPFMRADCLCWHTTCCMANTVCGLRSYRGNTCRCGCSAGVEVSEVALGTWVLSQVHAHGFQLAAASVQHVALGFPSFSRPLTLRLSGFKAHVQQVKLPKVSIFL